MQPFGDTCQGQAGSKTVAGVSFMGRSRKKRPYLLNRCAREDVQRQGEDVCTGDQCNRCPAGPKYELPELLRALEYVFDLEQDAELCGVN